MDPRRIEDIWHYLYRGAYWRRGPVTMRAIAAVDTDLAAMCQIRTGSHGATDLSPVTMGCALHFDTWVPNFRIQEYMRRPDETDAVFPHDYRFEKGELLRRNAGSWRRYR